MDIYAIIEDLKKQPQTYYTILGRIYTNRTQHEILRRKLNREFKKGLLCKTLIPGKAFSVILFYVLDKDYAVFFVQHGLGVRCLYCKVYTETALEVSLTGVNELVKTSWVSADDVTIDKENIIKVI